MPDASDSFLLKAWVPKAAPAELRSQPEIGLWFDAQRALRAQTGLMITVLLVGDLAAVLRALRETLVGQDQISIVGEASDPDRATRLAESLRPQVIVLDAEMADVEVPALADHLHTRSPTSALILLSLEPGRLASLIGAQLPVEIVSKIEGVSALLAAIRRAGRR